MIDENSHTMYIDRLKELLDDSKDTPADVTGCLDVVVSVAHQRRTRKDTSAKRKQPTAKPVRGARPPSPPPPPLEYVRVHDDPNSTSTIIV
jgi:hypothetical protein